MADSVEIDLKTRFLSKNHNIYVLHPGEKKKFYFDFIEQNLVFLDMPGVTFPRTVDVSKVELRQMLRVGRRVGAWHRAGRNNEARPSRNPRDYRPAGAVRYVSEVQGLYGEAGRGDLVVAPGPGYITEVHIGELTEEFNPRVFAKAKVYPEERIPARRVRWLSKDKIKAHFSRRLIELMQNPQALIRISVPAEKREIYDLAYSDYSMTGEATGLIRVTKTNVDLHELNQSNELLSYFAAMYHALDDNELAEFVRLDIAEAIAKYYDRTYFHDTAININSPGWIRQRAKAITLPAFVGTMIALSGSEPDLEIAKNVYTINSEPLSDAECNKEVDDRIRGAMDMIQYDLWQEICKRRKAARDSVGMESDSTAKKKKNKKEKENK